MVISKDLITIFKDDLCKDQREMKVLCDTEGVSSSGMILRKYNTSVEEYNNEIKVIDYLCAQNVGGIPRVLRHGFEGQVPYIDIEYFDGIRVYNLLAYMREIAEEIPDLADEAQELSGRLKERCLERQIAIQKSLILWAQECGKTEVYPQKKLRNIVSILARVMKLQGLDYGKLDSELEYIIDRFESIATVPFRDATTKNMVIYLPELYLERFLGDDGDVIEADRRRKQAVIELLRSGGYERIAEAAIVDFDFSSCEHLTTVYDDPIGFSCHEIMWQGMPKPEALLWGGSAREDNGVDIAISFIVRFLRFGGRKLCYHIFHPHAYKYRFKYDNENFYFEHLNELIEHHWENARSIIPQFMSFVDRVVEFDKREIIDNIDEFELAYPDCNRKFYLDLFPY